MFAFRGSAGTVQWLRSSSQVAASVGLMDLYQKLLMMHPTWVIKDGNIPKHQNDKISESHFYIFSLAMIELLPVPKLLIHDLSMSSFTAVIKAGKKKQHPKTLKICAFYFSKGHSRQSLHDWFQDSTSKQCSVCASLYESTFVLLFCRVFIGIPKHKLSIWVLNTLTIFLAWK